MAEADEPEQRYELFRQAERMLVDDVVGVTLSYDQLRTGLSDRVTGFAEGAAGRYLPTTPSWR